MIFNKYNAAVIATGSRRHSQGVPCRTSQLVMFQCSCCIYTDSAQEGLTKQSSDLAAGHIQAQIVHSTLCVAVCGLEVLAEVPDGHSCISRSVPQQGSLFRGCFGTRLGRSANAPSPVGRGHQKVPGQPLPIAAGHHLQHKSRFQHLYYLGLQKLQDKAIVPAMRAHGWSKPKQAEHLTPQSRKALRQFCMFRLYKAKFRAVMHVICVVQIVTRSRHVRDDSPCQGTTPAPSRAPRPAPASQTQWPR